MTEASEIATNAENKGIYEVMHSILACTRIGSNATTSGFTQMHGLLFDISFTDKNDINVNKSKACVAG